MKITAVCLATILNSRPDLEIVLDLCKITSAGASALAEVLGHNQGPTTIDDCGIDNFIIANGLRGNSSLKSLTPRISYSPENGNRELLAIAGALRENKGLVSLTCGFMMSDEAWDAVSDSLETYPTLEVLDLRSREGFMAPAELKSRIQALVDMMKVSMSIHTIELHARYRQHELLKESVIPYLESQSFLISRRISSGRAFLPSKNSPAGVPCWTSACCCTNRSQSHLDAFIRECRSYLSIDHCDCESPNAC
jgi:hypothetical protein